MGLIGQLISAAAVRSPRMISVFAAAGLCALPGVSLAGEWTITPRASVQTTWTDNANEARDGEDRNSDFLVQGTPGVTITGTGGRFSLALNFSHTESLSMLDATDNESINTLAANGRAELYDRVFFVDATSSISRQVIDSAAPVSSVDTGTSNNRTTVQTASLEPFFLHHFGTWLETESRTRLDMTRTESEEISDTQTIGQYFNFNSGRRFSTFTFSGALSDEKIVRDNGAPSSNEMVAVTNYRLRVLPRLSLLSSLGWENIDDPTLTDEPNGITWNVGFAAQPNSRSSIELTYGTELQEQAINLNATYALSSRTRLAASYSETITSSERLLNDDLDFVVGDGFGQLIDSRTGLPFDATNDNFGFTTSLFRQRVFTLTLNAQRRLWSYAGGLTWEQRKTDSTGVEETVTTADISATRPLNSRLSATIAASVSLHDFGTDDQREDKDYTLSGSLTYQLNASTTAALSYTRDQTRSSEGANNFNDNTVTLNLTHTF